MPNIQALLSLAVESLRPVSDTALLEAEILLSKILAKDRAYLRAWPEKELTTGQIESYNALVLERQQGKPLAYIIGSREFWSKEFLVSPAVLIPRPDTELLIELSLKLIPKNLPCNIIDLGTGSGVIAITLAVERPNAQIFACDLSLEALEIAKINAVKHKVETIQFYHSHWFDNISDGKFSLIVSNPPYLAEGDDHLSQGDLRFEPQIALVADQDGLSDIRLIAKTARNRLENGGNLVMEHGYDQSKAVQNIFHQFGYQDIRTHTDLAGHPRVTSGQYKS